MIGRFGRAAVFGTDGRFALQELEERPVREDEIRVRVQAAGVCGTDLHILEGDYPSCPPVILGHEFAGEVVEAGEAVSNVVPGDLVSIEPHVYCRTCKPCVDGNEHLCVRRRGFGVHMNGGFAETAVVPGRNAYRLPGSISGKLGALAEPLGCCMHGVERAELELGDNVVVFGAGPIGLMLTRLVSRAGAASVLVVEPVRSRREAAREYGATAVAKPDEAAEAIGDITEGYGADVVFEATGLAAVFEQGLELTASGGRLMVFGVTAPSARASVSPNRIYRDEITIMGSLINPFVHRRALNLLPSLQLDAIVTHTYPLEKIEEAFEVARAGEALKVQILPNS